MSDEQLPQAAPPTDCWAPKTPEPPCAASESDTAIASPDRAERYASFGALLSAFIASSWCWLPPLLILGGISGAGMTTFVEEHRTLFMVGTIGILAWAFHLTYRPRPAATGSRSKIMTANKVVLWIVTAMVVVFLFFPHTITNLMASNDEFTEDMERTVIAIEGMTWHTWTPIAEKAIKTAPGVLAVRVDYETKRATIGTKKGEHVPKAEILKALDTVKYTGEFVND